MKSLNTPEQAFPMTNIQAKTHYNNHNSFGLKPKVNQKPNEIIKQIFSRGIYTQRGNRKQEKKIKLQGNKVYTTQTQFMNHSYIKQRKKTNLKYQWRSSKGGSKNHSSSSSNKRTKVFTVRKKDASTGFLLFNIYLGDYGNNARNFEEDEGSDSDGYTNLADIYSSSVLRKSMNYIHKKQMKPHLHVSMVKDSSPTQ